MKKLDRRFAVTYVIVFALLLVGVTYALVTESLQFNVTTAMIGIDEDVYGDTTFDASELDFKPIIDSTVGTTSSEDNVIKIDFNVRGASYNDASDPIIYDIALNDLNVSCALLSSYIKWKLLKNDTEIATGSLDYKFDTIEDGRLVLTSVQQALPSSTETADSYTFYMWLSDSCQYEDIATCKTNNQIADQSALIGQVLKGKIEVELYTGSTKTLVRNPKTSLDSSTCTNYVSHVVTLNAGDGNASTDSIQVYENQPYGALEELPTPVKGSEVTFITNGGSAVDSVQAFSTFEGWYLESTYVNKVTNDTLNTTTGDHTLYAKWTDSTITSITLPTTTQSSFTLEGWYSDAALTNKVGNAGDTYNITGNAALYAKWSYSVYNVTYSSGNLMYGLDDKSSTTSNYMTYSISDGVVTVTGNTADGYGTTTGRVYLEAYKTYYFSCNTNGTWNTSETDTMEEVEAFLLYEGTTTYFVHIDSNENFEFTPTQTGVYHLRLDVNAASTTRTFSNIRVTTNAVKTYTNLVYGLEDKSSTTSQKMTYSISNGVVTVKANSDDGYGQTTGRVDLEAYKTYVFSCDTSGVWSSTDVQSGDTVEAFLMKDGGSTAYYHIDSNRNFTFTPTVTGTYWLRLDVNSSGIQNTFSNIKIYEASFITSSDNLVTGLDDKSSTTTSYMNYSISNGVVSVTATRADGWGYTPGRVNLEAGKYYMFSCTTNASTWKQTDVDTDVGDVEAYLMKDGGSTNYLHLDSYNDYIFTVPATGEYWLRLDVNTNGSTYTFSDINIVEASNVVSVTYGDSVDLSPIVLKSDYSFVGWNTEIDSVTALSSLTMEASDITLYPVFKKNINLIKRYYNGVRSDLNGDVYNTDRYYNFTLGTPTVPSGYTFRGWSTSGSATATINVSANASVALSDNAIYFASYYNASAGTLAYNVNGGSGSISSTSIPGYMNAAGAVSYSSVKVTSSKPTSPSYRVFSSWNTNSSGTGTNYAAGATYSGSGTTLYAKYRYMTGTITLSDTCSRLNVRGSASASGTLLGVLHHGDSISVASISGSWYYIYANVRSTSDYACDSSDDSYAGYMWGYVSTSYVSSLS